MLALQKKLAPAEKALRQAVRLDPSFGGAWHPAPGMGPATRLLASASMKAAAANALRAADARNVERILGRLGSLWKAPALADLPVALNPRLSRTLGRLVGRPWRIELGPKALASDERLREVVTHEAAHAALARRDGATPQAPHGREWRQLMALAGYPGRPPEPTAPATLYDHWCPVCQSSRTGRRPVKAWRCAACVAAGLDGRLEITRRTRGPAATP